MGQVRGGKPVKPVCEAVRCRSGASCGPSRVWETCPLTAMHGALRPEPAHQAEGVDARVAGGAGKTGIAQLAQEPVRAEGWVAGEQLLGTCACAWLSFMAGS